MITVSYSFFWEQLLRCSGLAIVNDFLHRARRKESHEEAKVVVDRSRRLALGRCSVHILPVSVSVIILWINFKEAFIGIDFRSLISSETINIALLQTAAKVQELLIVASLATVAFQLIRYELIHGNGLPLGLLAAGLDFAKLSWLWSPELLGALWKPDRTPGRFRRVAIVFYLVMAAGLAALAGPSCAVLLIPQAQHWPAGVVRLYLNDSMNHLWPTDLSALSSQLRDICVSADAIRYGVCPSGGYYSLLGHYAQADIRTYTNAVPPYARELSGNTYYWSYASSPPVTIRTMSLMVGDGSDLNPTSFIQPTLSVSVILDQAMQVWWQTLQAKGGYASYNVEDRAAKSKSFNPITTVRCSTGQNMSTSDRAVSFPTPGAPGSYDMRDLGSAALSRNPSRHLQFKWIPLPEQGRRISIGAVFESPWTPDNRSRIVVGCTVHSQWIPTQIHTDGYSFWQGWYPKDVRWGKAYPSSGHALFNGSTAPDGMNAIAVVEDWLAMLTPAAGQSQGVHRGWEPTTIEAIIDSTPLTDGLFDSDDGTPMDVWQAEQRTSRQLLVSIIGSVFNDGLARVGIEKAFDRRGPPSQWTPLAQTGVSNASTNNTTEIKVDFSIGGLSYQLTIVQKLAAAVLLLHILIALVHSAWIILWTGESSSCWDSVIELVVLAQNSRPAFSALGNTAAGIKRSSTFTKKVNIRPTKASRARPDHVELIYEDEEVLADHGERIELREYSTDNAALQSRGIVHPSTWPVRRPYNRQTSPWSIQDFHCEDSTPDTPLISAASGDTSDHSIAARVQVGHAYG
ncbi:MAG: hypothetical protein Q9207_004087 [Kuettlingeria erythrocarpa]